MKKTITLIAALVLATTIAKAQTDFVSFEDLVLPTDSFYQDSNAVDFVSGNVSFQYDWDAGFNYWSGGFSYSNKTDSVTSGYTNMYSAKAAKGYNNSSNYVVSQNFTGIKFPGMPSNVVNGMYLTNSTYAFNSMRDGDMFAKKFGGVSGNDPDWFKLIIRGYNSGIEVVPNVEFYLADFRFSNNAQDYILKTWEYVDLTTLGSVDSISFELNSSDVGGFGMNTPAYFCLDEIWYTPDVIGLKENERKNISLYPNPAQNEINLSLSSTITIIGICSIVDLTGTEVLSTEIQPGTSSLRLGVKGLDKGVYFVRINTGNEVITKKFIKE